MVPRWVKGLGARGLAVALPVLVVSGCGELGSEGPAPNPLGPEPPSQADTEAVWSYLEGSDYQRFWKPETPTQPGLMPGRGYHGSLLRTYVNSVADSARPLGKDPAPSGSVVVLNSYTQEPHLQAVYVMAKVAGHNEATNDWAFYRFGPEGGAEVTDAEARRRHQEQERGCIHCHSRTQETDFLFQPRLR